MKDFKVYIEVLQALLLRFLYPDDVRHFAAMIWCHDFLCYFVPKCSLVDYDAIEPRTLCLEDGSINSPLLVQIHHAKRTETWQKDKYLNSAAD